jgi:phosphoadenosine phosphosulfate reductase
MSALPLDRDGQPGIDLDAVNGELATRDADGRVRWAVEHLPGAHALSTSFGAQAAVALHLVTRVAPGIPVILVDTGYLFPETYRFADELQARLRLNLKVYRPELTPAWLEARHGRLWEQGPDRTRRLGQLTKVEPMRRALAELGVSTWIAGLRRVQSRSRSALKPLAQQEGRWKLSPLFDWTDRDVYQYLTRHDLPYHPLWHQGYVSIGDVHTTRPAGEGVTGEQTRFGGTHRECGLHDLDAHDTHGPT